ncbi:hemerythrin domain-containing protein [Nannocystis pusilla]|uniref:hemerythrin domain-containing protein n=1 Tax=Nannocystis pusilla TaxID=889268 RepID=UPI003B7DE6A5
MSEPTIWDLLERDHEAFGAQLAELQAAAEAAARELLPPLVCDLTAHARAKEAVLYGHLLHDERARGWVVEGLQELERIRAALTDLELLPAGDEVARPARRAGRRRPDPLQGREGRAAGDRPPGAEREPGHRAGGQLPRRAHADQGRPLLFRRVALMLSSAHGQELPVRRHRRPPRRLH